MNRRINNLSHVYEKMCSRYGSQDALVLQLKESLEQLTATEPLHIDANKPFGERRSKRGKPSYWNVKLRQPHEHQTRSDIIAECQRVELRTHS
jgi:broad specificity polyphosphatase/5'/3'-nucleotidase SurE